MIKYSLDIYWTPKKGNTHKEYEDAYAIGPVHDKTEEYLKKYINLNSPSKNLLLKCAIADGATQGIFSKNWAKIIVKSFCSGLLELENFQSGMNLIYLLWDKYKSSINYKENLPWYVQEKIQQGAFSTLLGINFYINNKFECLSVGDSCLFQIRNNIVITKFPINKSINFSNTPFLIPSNNIQYNILSEHLKVISGDWKQNDHFYLMTDAIAEWFLFNLETNNNPITMLNNIKNQSQFENFVNNERINKYPDGKSFLKNDDTTIIRICLYEEE